LYYAFATSILFLCDGGGSNSSNYYIFKEDLQKLANEIGIEIRIQLIEESRGTIAAFGKPV
jgi:hypothetical protein